MIHTWGRILIHIWSRSRNQGRSWSRVTRVGCLMQSEIIHEETQQYIAHILHTHIHSHIPPHTLSFSAVNELF